MSESTRLTPDELEALIKSGRQITVLDVRKDPDQYVEGHVPGARYISVYEIENALPSLPKDQLIVTYCNGGNSCVIAADKLKEHGLDVQVMSGFRDWKEQRKPVEPGG